MDVYDSLILVDGVSNINLVTAHSRENLLLPFPLHPCNLKLALLELLNPLLQNTIEDCQYCIQPLVYFLQPTGGVEPPKIPSESLALSTAEGKSSLLW